MALAAATVVVGSGSAALAGDIDPGSPTADPTYQIVPHTVIVTSHVKMVGPTTAWCWTQGFVVIPTAAAEKYTHDVTGVVYYKARGQRRTPEAPTYAWDSFGDNLVTSVNDWFGWGEFVIPPLYKYDEVSHFTTEDIAAFTASGWEEYGEVQKTGTGSDRAKCSPEEIAAREAGTREALSTDNYRVWAPGANNNAPVPDFEWAISDTGPRTVDFTNTSTDPDGDPLTYSWSFGDSAVSSEENPSHTYTGTGNQFDVTLTVSDGHYNPSVTKTVTLGMTVNSTADRPDDGTTAGCDTGQEVAGVPECTLRAAIQTANETGGGTIGFAIDNGSAVPTIGVASALPPITAPSTTIDGTTQEAKSVRVVGAPLNGALLTVKATDTAITGLQLDAAADGIVVSDGGVADIHGNVFGATPALNASGSLTEGISLRESAGSGSAVHDNTFGAHYGVVNLAPGTSITKNRIGVTPNGRAVLDGSTTGVFTAGNQSTVNDNTIWAKTVGVLVTGWSAKAAGSDTSVIGNRIGVNSARDGVLDGAGDGIRIDGVARATVSSNVVVGGGTAGIGVTGRVTTTIVNTQAGGVVVLGTYGGPASSNPVSGGGSTISGNSIGARAMGLSATSEPTMGIAVWESASNITIDGNRIGGGSLRGVVVDGGSANKVAGNEIGTAGAGGAVNVGVAAVGTDDVVIGATGNGNSIAALYSGVSLSGVVLRPTVTANTITSATPANTNGVGVSGADTVGLATVTSNTVSGFTRGVSLAGNAPTVTDNTVDATAVGILTDGNTAQILRNKVKGAGDRGISAHGTDLTVSENLVGIDSFSATTFAGLGGTGIAVPDGSTAQVRKNAVAGAGGDGIQIGSSSVASLTGNRITGSAGTPITPSASAPGAPTIVAAIDTTKGQTSRITLIVSGFPGDAGTLEVFANGSCADPEADRVLEVTRTVSASQSVRIVQIVGRTGADNFTATFTTADGGTSGLSACTAIKPYPDTDGDGSPDPIDDLYGGAGDPTKAAVVTDDEQVLGILVAKRNLATGTGGGTLSGIGIVDAPAPTTGFTLPYGTLSYTVEGLSPGGSTQVSIISLYEQTDIRGNGYVKYGEEAAGQSPHWYTFGYDEATGTGATVSDPIDIPGLGYRRAYILNLVDGQRGDSGLATDGQIVDPGGPATYSGDGPGLGAPPAPAPTPPPSEEGSTVPGVPGSTAPPSDVAAAADAAVAVQGELPYTGSSPGGLLAVGVAALAFGALLWAVDRRRRRGPVRRT